ncbi:MAG: hypothetical protein QM689_11340 [Oscillospiraceae bacterium]
MLMIDYRAVDECAQRFRQQSLLLFLQTDALRQIRRRLLEQTTFDDEILELTKLADAMHAQAEKLDRMSRALSRISENTAQCERTVDYFYENFNRTNEAVIRTSDIGFLSAYMDGIRME